MIAVVAVIVIVVHIISCDVLSQEIRKAYRKLAMKYHPDKNPQGRDMFEKIQKAYELLNAARYYDRIVIACGC